MLWNSSESVNQKGVLLPLAGEARPRTSASGQAREGELLTWLCALRSYFNPRNHPLSEADRAAILTRDFKGEARITREALMQCLQAALSLAASFEPAGLDDSMSGLGLISPLQASAGLSRAVAPAGDVLCKLADALRAAYRFNAALLQKQSVSFQDWAGLYRLPEPHINAALRQLSYVFEQGSMPELELRLRTMSETVKPDEFGTDLETFFRALCRVLDHLGFVERELKGDRPLKLTLPVFTLVREETRAALDRVERRALRVEGVEPALLEALDGTAYAIRIELRKSFEHELVDLCHLRQPQQVYARVETAHGLLRDCFQQSIVSLAALFEPGLEGGDLFSSFRAKLDQSLALRRDLWRLMMLSQRVERERDDAALPTLIAALAQFREVSLRNLMYKDWESFERFVEEVEARRGGNETTHVLHRFNAYLETLFGQISMRAVLANHPFDPSEVTAF